METRLNNRFNNGLDDLQVLVNEVQTGFTWLLWGTGRDHNQVGVLARVVIGAVNQLRGRERGSVFEVEGVPFRALLAIIACLLNKWLICEKTSRKN